MIPAEFWIALGALGAANVLFVVWLATLDFFYSRQNRRRAR